MWRFIYHLSNNCVGKWKKETNRQSSFSFVLIVYYFSYALVKPRLSVGCVTDYSIICMISECEVFFSKIGKYQVYYILLFPFLLNLKIYFFSSFMIQPLLLRKVIF